MQDAVMRCPISEDLSPVTVAGDYKEFDCPTCGRYRVSNTVMVTHEGKHEELAEALQQARRRVSSDQIPMISNLLTM
jgi:uncharacterized radical SAM superfamily protein